jgi:hypothetical protein
MAHSKTNAQDGIMVDGEQVNRLYEGINALREENKQLKREVLEERIAGLTAKIRLAEMMKEQAETELARIEET